MQATSEKVSKIKANQCKPGKNGPILTYYGKYMAAICDEACAKMDEGASFAARVLADRAFLGGVAYAGYLGDVYLRKFNVHPIIDDGRRRHTTVITPLPGKHSAEELAGIPDVASLVARRRTVGSKMAHHFGLDRRVRFVMTPGVLDRIVAGTAPAHRWYYPASLRRRQPDSEVECVYFIAVPVTAAIMSALCGLHRAFRANLENMEPVVALREALYEHKNALLKSRGLENPVKLEFVAGTETKQKRKRSDAEPVQAEPVEPPPKRARLEEPPRRPCGKSPRPAPPEAPESPRRPAGKSLRALAHVPPPNPTEVITDVCNVLTAAMDTLEGGLTFGGFADAVNRLTQDAMDAETPPVELEHLLAEALKLVVEAHIWSTLESPIVAMAGGSDYKRRMVAEVSDVVQDFLKRGLIHEAKNAMLELADSFDGINPDAWSRAVTRREQWQGDRHRAAYRYVAATLQTVRTYNADLPLEFDWSTITRRSLAAAVNMMADRAGPLACDSSCVGDKCSNMVLAKSLCDYCAAEATFTGRAPLFESDTLDG